MNLPVRVSPRPGRQRDQEHPRGGTRRAPKHLWSAGRTGPRRRSALKQESTRTPRVSHAASRKSPPIRAERSSMPQSPRLVFRASLELLPGLAPARRRYLPRGPRPRAECRLGRMQGRGSGGRDPGVHSPMSLSMSQRPTVLRVNAYGQLHAEDEPTVLLPDGSQMWTRDGKALPPP